MNNWISLSTQSKDSYKMLNIKEWLKLLLLASKIKHKKPNWLPFFNENVC